MCFRVGLFQSLQAQLFNPKPISAKNTETRNFKLKFT